MRYFRDAKGRRWGIEINGGTIKRVRSLVAFDLLCLVEGNGDAALKLRDDQVLLGDIAYAICEPEATAKEISDEEFGRSLIGDVIDEAWTEILGGLADFFTSRRRRLLTAAVMQAAVAMELDERAKQSLLGPPPAATCGANSSKWRAAWGWLRGRTPTANCR